MITSICESVRAICGSGRSSWSGFWR